MAEYFSHDYAARHDPKLVKLQMVFGQEGKGIFWDLTELMYEQEGFLLLSQIETYAYSFKCDAEKLKKIVNDFDLYENDGVSFWSESIKRRLKERKDKSVKALKSINNRWKNKRIAGEIRTYYESNTIKESKVKENKEKEIKEKKENKTPLVIPSHLLEIWPHYLEMRKLIKKPATENAQDGIIKDLEKLAPGNLENQVKIVQQSINNSWQGVFELKERASTSTQRTRESILSGVNRE